MVKIPNTNLLTIGGILVAVFFITREIRGAGQDLAKFGENLKFPSFPSINIGGSTLSAPSVVESKFPQASDQTIGLLTEFQKGLANLGLSQQGILDKLGQLPPLGTPQNPATSPVAPTGIDVVINDPSLTQAQKDALLGLLNPPTEQGREKERDLSQFNPPNVFGFGVLGKGKGGISEQIAKRLGIFGLEVNGISRLQKARLSGLSSTDTLQSLIDVKSKSSINRFISSFNITDFSGIIFGREQRAVGTTQRNIMTQQRNITTPFTKIESKFGNFKIFSTTGSTGLINETPIGNLSISQIIDKFGVSASKASSIRRKALGFPSIGRGGFVPEGFINNSNNGFA